jgi:hypothetical protein
MKRLTTKRSPVAVRSSSTPAKAGAVERVRLAWVRAVGGAVEPLDGRRRGRGHGRVLRPRRGGERAQAEEQQQRVQPQCMQHDNNDRRASEETRWVAPR